MGRLFACLLLLLPSILSAETLFRETATLDITLSGPLQTLFENREQAEEMPFTMQLNGTTHPLQVRTRGNFRLKHCDFPPLRLNLKTSAMAGTVFDGQDKLKLVTHCRNYERAEKDLIEEYLAYRMFAHLTENALGTRLLRVRYEDTASGAIHEHHAIILESVDGMAARLGIRRATRTEVRRSEFEPEQAALAYVFAYLIGNTDFSLVAAYGDSECCHNGILLEQADKTLVLVPYDFDLAGIVDADYAAPNPSLRIKSVTRRLYRGYCLDNREALASALDRIIDARGAFYTILDGLPLLSDREKSRKKAWLERFYGAAENPGRLLDSFEKRCL